MHMGFGVGDEVCAAPFQTGLWSDCPTDSPRIFQNRLSQVMIPHHVEGGEGSMVRFHIREAGAADQDKIVRFLSEAGMVIEGVLAPQTKYWLAESLPKMSMIGVIGVEQGPEAALLRSALVVPEKRAQGVGAALVRQVFAACEQSGYRHLYCFSTTAGTYWQRWGFEEVPVAELVSAVPCAPQVLHFGRLGGLSSEVAWRKNLFDDGKAVSQTV